MTPHFFVAAEQVTDDVAVLGPDDARHLVTVLRARRGDQVTVSDGRGILWHATYEGSSGNAAAVRLLDRTEVPAPRPSLTVVHALPKQRKLDEVVQRLTELGVRRIVPVHSERSQVHLDERRAAKALTRWRAIALAAAKQSRRAWLPQVTDVGSWDTAFSSRLPGVVCWEESSTGLREVLTDAVPSDEFLIAIGPEGGLTASEVAASGLPHACLGTSILRTETAGLVAAAAVGYHFGLMEPQ